MPESTNHKILLDTIIEQLHQSTTMKDVEHTKASYPSAMKILGLKVSVVREIQKQYKHEFAIMNNRELIDFGKMLIRTKIFECEQLAFELISNKWKILQDFTLADLHDYILALSTSENRWLKRCSLVATIPLNLKARGGKGDYQRTIMMCELHIDSRDDMIVKALSWALRELSKTYPEPVEDFINEYEERISPKVLREVRTKLYTGLKRVAP
jgi:3-methyladenine DNA glycosylase AlkD